MNSELQTAAEALADKFPGKYIVIEESYSIGACEISEHHFRASVVIDSHTVYGANGVTVYDAIAAVVEQSKKPRTEKINAARALLESEGYTFACPG